LAPYVNSPENAPSAGSDDRAIFDRGRDPIPNDRSHPNRELEAHAGGSDCETPMVMAPTAKISAPM